MARLPLFALLLCGVVLAVSGATKDNAAREMLESLDHQIADLEARIALHAANRHHSRPDATPAGLIESSSVRRDEGEKAFDASTLQRVTILGADDPKPELHKALIMTSGLLGDTGVSDPAPALSGSASPPSTTGTTGSQEPSATGVPAGTASATGGSASTAAASTGAQQTPGTSATTGSAAPSASSTGPSGSSGSEDLSNAKHTRVQISGVLDIVQNDSADIKVQALKNLALLDEQFSTLSKQLDDLSATRTQLRAALDLANGIAPAPVQAAPQAVIPPPPVKVVSGSYMTLPHIGRGEGSPFAGNAFTGDITADAASPLFPEAVNGDDASNIVAGVDKRELNAFAAQLDNLASQFADQQAIGRSEEAKLIPSLFLATQSQQDVSLLEAKSQGGADIVTVGGRRVSLDMPPPMPALPADAAMSFIAESTSISRSRSRSRQARLRASLGLLDDPAPAADASAAVAVAAPAVDAAPAPTADAAPADAAPAAADAAPADAAPAADAASSIPDLTAVAPADPATTTAAPVALDAAAPAADATAAPVDAAPAADLAPPTPAIDTRFPQTSPGMIKTAVEPPTLAPTHPEMFLPDMPTLPPLPGQVRVVKPKIGILE